MDSLLDGLISDLRKQNPEYKACREDEKNNVDKFEEVLDRLQKDDRDFIKKHEINIFNIYAIEQSYIYYRGYVGCIKLIKVLA